MFSCEFCEILKNTFFTERLWTTSAYRSTHFVEMFPFISSVEIRETLRHKFNSFPQYIFCYISFRYVLCSSWTWIVPWLWIFSEYARFFKRKSQKFLWEYQKIFQIKFPYSLDIAKYFFSMLYLRYLNDFVGQVENSETSKIAEISKKIFWDF